MKKKEKPVANEWEQWTQLEPGGPQDWNWVEKNGMRYRPATKNWDDVVRPPDLPKMTEEEFEELMRWDRDDER
jgi:hypothetical protein